jgi:IS1 family transposase
MNRLDAASRCRVIAALVEGNSLRSTSRMTGVAINTVVKLLVDAGRACADYQDRVMRNLSCQRLQCDEIWQYVYCKQKNLTEKISESRVAGDTWTWTAIDAETKLVPCWMIGQRDAIAARDFMEDLAGRLANRVQLTTDGLKTYLTAVQTAFGNNIDYAMLVKQYGLPEGAEKRYSPSVCIGCESHTITHRCTGIFQPTSMPSI